jgi:Tfp pilus assembly ATPase PilU
MRTLDEALANLVKEKKITLEQALIKSSNQQQLKGYLGLGLTHARYPETPDVFRSIVKTVPGY